MKIATIHVDPMSEVSSLSPIRRYLLAVLLLALKDRATSICHTMTDGHSHLTCRIDDQWQNLEPIPELLCPIVGRELWNWINPSPFRWTIASGLRRLASRFDPDYLPSTSYPFMLIVDPTWSIWGVTIQSGGDRERVTFDLLECTDWSREQLVPIIELIRPTGDREDAEVSA